MASKAQANFFIVNTRCIHSLLHIASYSGRGNPLRIGMRRRLNKMPSFVNFKTICKHQSGFVGKSLRFFIRVLNNHYSGVIKLKFNFTNKSYSILLQHQFMVQNQTLENLVKISYLLA